MSEEKTTPRNFDIDTAIEDFAGPGREIHKGVGDRELFDGREVFSERHIWIRVNGWTISVTWGTGTYSTAGRDLGAYASWDRATSKESPNAEVAAWRTRDGETGRASLIELDGDSVAGWQSPAAVVGAIEAAEHDDEEGIRSALSRKEDE